MFNYQPGDFEQLHALCRSMFVADQARMAGLPELTKEQLAPWISQFEQFEGLPLTKVIGHQVGPSSTTHVSTVDQKGNFIGPVRYRHTVVVGKPALVIDEAGDLRVSGES